VIAREESDEAEIVDDIFWPTGNQRMVRLPHERLTKIE
jgi:hypothetical protein